MSSACWGNDSPRGPRSGITSLSPVATTPVPLSANASIVAADERTVCTTVSWEHQIHCTSRRGEAVAIFGSEGEGPGEYRHVTSLTRGSPGTIAVFDMHLARATIVEFRSAKVVQVTYVSCAVIYFILKVTTSTITGLCAVATFDGFQIGSELHMTGVDIRTNEVLWKRGLPHPTAVGVEAECQYGLSWGTLRPNGGSVFGTCQREIVFYPEDPAHEVAVVVAPAYTDEFPNDRDVQDGPAPIWWTVDFFCRSRRQR